MQRTGQIKADGSPATRDRSQQVNRVKEPRTPPVQFVREVIAELKKVSWPTREETIRLSIIVLVAIIVMTSFIFAVDYVFENGTSVLFKTDTGAALLLSALGLG